MSQIREGTFRNYLLSENFSEKDIDLILGYLIGNGYAKNGLIEFPEDKTVGDILHSIKRGE